MSKTKHIFLCGVRRLISGLGLRGCQLPNESFKIDSYNQILLIIVGCKNTDRLCSLLRIGIFFLSRLFNEEIGNVCLVVFRNCLAAVRYNLVAIHQLSSWFNCISTIHVWYMLSRNNVKFTRDVAMHSFLHQAYIVCYSDRPNKTLFIHEFWYNTS